MPCGPFSLPSRHSDRLRAGFCFPELTRSPGIQLNERLSLRRHPRALSLPHRTIAPVRDYPSGDHIPLGGFVMSKKMTNSKAPLSGFRIVCEICDRLGIVFDCTEDAPSSTQINCRHCGAPRGTLGELRNLSAETCVAKK
jgi:hypothetical protein